MKKAAIRALSALAVGSIVVLAALPTPVAASATEANCGALATVEFSRIVDAPTQLLSATFVKAGEDLPAYCVPRVIQLIGLDEFPRNVTGKIDRNALARRLADGRVK